MKIKSYKKDRDSQYEITFENKEKIKLHEDLILKYELLLKKEIEDNKLENIIIENKKYELYTKCLKFLASKMRTKKEICKKFKDYDNESINLVIDKLTKEGYLNDVEYIKAYINDQINLKCIGPNKIRKDLISLGLYETDINQYLETFNDEIWNNKIKKLIDKEIKSNHTKSNSMLAIKITNNLINKGFDKNMISSQLNSNKFKPDDEILEKEVNKLYKKYKDRAEEAELKIQIINKLVAKGYNKDKIKEYLDKCIN